ncbi:hypothetical protein Golax_004072 [Gossypium laxum]|uniref:Uncharacterized protein n=1 Tax=Gossypium laxum TaxID=34288 RepID=A0A7J9AHI0_9ROSI|nr:hypothetical protein [Gossypium laxum]
MCKTFFGLHYLHAIHRYGKKASNVLLMKHLKAEVEFIDGTFKDGSSKAIRALMGNLEIKYYLAGTTVGPHPCPSMGGRPDILVACIGSGSNALGLFHEFISDEDVRLIGVEAARRLCQLEGFFKALEASHALAFLEKLCPTLPNGTKVVVNLSSRRDKGATIVFQYQPDQLIDRYRYQGWVYKCT